MPNANGAAIFFDVRQKYAEASDKYWQKTAFSIVANYLPAPSSSGDYDTYEGFAQIPGLISWRFNLFPHVYVPPGMHDNQIRPMEYTWAGKFVGITASLTRETKVQVRLANSKTDKLGPAVLQATLNDCR